MKGWCAMSELTELDNGSTLGAALTQTQTRVLFVFNALTGLAHLVQAIAILVLSRAAPAVLPVFIFRYDVVLCGPSSSLDRSML